MPRRRTPPRALTPTAPTAIDMQGFDLALSLYNYDKFKNELKEFDPKLRRAMDKEIRNVLQPIANTARGLVPDQPLSGWRYGDERYTPSRLPYWNPSTARKGIVVKQGGKRKSGFAEQAAWRISNLDGAAAAFELAGRKKATNVLGDSLLAAGLGKPRRLIWRAWYESKGWQTANKSIRQIVQFYEQQLQRSFDSNSLEP
jgi:hypothetical protein